MNSERADHPVPVYGNKEEVDMIDDWYAAFKFGSIFFPQTTTATTIITLERLLTPLEPKIVRFAAHTLSDYQIDNLGAALTHHHNRIGVKLQFQRKATHGQRKRMGELWEQTKVDVLDCLSERFRRGELVRKQQLIREAQLIQEAVDHQPWLLEEAHEEATIAAAFLFDPAGIQFSDLYREEVVKEAQMNDMPRGMVAKYLQSRLFSSGYKERDYAWLKIV